MELLQTLRRIRACEGDAAAQLLLEAYVAQEVAASRDRLGLGATVWARKDQLQHAATRGGLMCSMYPNTIGRTDLEPLYDQVALDAAVAAERERWRARVEQAFREGYWARETYNDNEVSDADEKWGKAKAGLLKG